MKKTILIIGKSPNEWELTIAKLIRNQELPWEMIFISDNSETKAFGQKLVTFHFGENEQNDCKEIEEACVQLLVSAVLFTPDYSTVNSKMFEQYFQTKEKLQKVKIIPPIYGYDGTGTAIEYIKAVKDEKI